MPRLSVINGKAVHIWTAPPGEGGSEIAQLCNGGGPNAESNTIADHGWWALHAKRRAARKRKRAA